MTLSPLFMKFGGPPKGGGDGGWGRGGGGWDLDPPFPTIVDDGPNGNYWSHENC